MQYIIIYLAKNNSEIYDAKKISLHFISNILEKNNYLMDESLKNMLDNFNEALYIEHILLLLGKFEIKYFDVLTDDIKSYLKIDITDENCNIVSDYFKQENLLLTEEIFKNVVKKYILRYCLGNYKNANEIFNNINVENISQRDDLFSNKVFEDEKFEKEFSKLKELNQSKDKNYVIQYFLKKIFPFVNTDKNGNGNNGGSTIIKKKKKDKKKI